ncbi:hypothetical protein Q8G40_29565, partial [Klebsiella pneumoniae]|uniref:hypothetical protein n=1 Tax=Klebsiella pneumoniae TaxID=573 RepID=UPI003013473A
SVDFSSGVSALLVVSYQKCHEGQSAWLGFLALVLSLIFLFTAVKQPWNLSRPRVCLVSAGPDWPVGLEVPEGISRGKNLK